jgi:hypothetical protein
MNPSAGEEAVDAEILAFNARNRKGSSQTSLTNTFPLEIFPDWLQAYCHEIAASIEVPVDPVGFVLLGMLSAAYGTHIRVRPKEGFTKYCHDFFFLIAPVSLGKSPIFSHLQAPLYRIQQYVRANTAAPEEDSEPTSQPQLIVNDITPEALVKVQNENGGAAAIVTPETPLFARLSETGGSKYYLEAYLSSHTGEAYHVHRITRGPNEVECARLAIIAATQNATLRQIHNRPELENGGFLQRCTFFVAPPVTEADFRDDDPSVSWELAERYDHLVHELGVRFRMNDTEPFVFDPEARAAYVAWWNGFKTHRLEHSPNFDIAGHCSKLKDKLPRWTALLHALWCEEERREPGTVTLEDFERALPLVDFDIANFRAVQAIISKGPAEMTAEAVRKWCDRHRGHTVTLREIRRSVVALRKADERTQETALSALEDDGILKRIPNANPHGRPSPSVQIL